MEIKDLSSAYTLRRLTEVDVDSILSVLRGNPLFFRYCPPMATKESVLQDMQALPPGKSMQDKYYLGAFEGDVLIAVLDLILGYPEDETAFIGFFMVAASHQGRGVGTSLVSDLIHGVRKWGCKYTRLAYAKGNPQSRAFWKKNGFCEIGTEVDKGDYTAVIMQRSNE